MVIQYSLLSTVKKVRLMAELHVIWEIHDWIFLFSEASKQLHETPDWDRKLVLGKGGFNPFQSHSLNNIGPEIACCLNRGAGVSAPRGAQAPSE